MNPGSGNAPSPSENRQPTGADQVLGGGNGIQDDPFEAILDRALEVAFAPIIAEYKAARESRMADLNARIGEAKARAANG